jgi:hypothetical protein
MGLVRYWLIPYFVVAIVAHIIYYRVINPVDFDQYSPLSPKYDSTKAVVNPYWAGIFGGLIMFSVIIYISMASTLKRTTEKLWSESCHRIERLLRMVQTYNKYSPLQEGDMRCWYDFICSIPDLVFSELTCANTVFLDHAFDVEESPRVTISDLDTMGYDLFTRIFKHSFPGLERTFVATFDLLSALRAEHIAKVPQALYLFAIVGLVVLHTSLFSLYLAYLGWVVGSIAIVIIVIAIVKINDLMEGLGSIFELNCNYHCAAISHLNALKKRLATPYEKVCVESSEDDDSSSDTEDEIEKKAPPPKKIQPMLESVKVEKIPPSTAKRRSSKEKVSLSQPYAKLKHKSTNKTQ